MEFLNGLSDVVLAIVSLYVFFKYINPLDFSSTVLWESFILSVAIAAIFGALGFFGFEKAIPVSIFFQKLATINGAVGLVGATAALALGNDFSKWGSYSFIALGFVFLALYEVFDVRPVLFWVPIVCMSLVMILGLFAISRGKVKVGVWILLGVAFFAVGNFRKDIFGDGDFSISLYHLLMSAGVLSIGMANSDAVLVRRD
jgi:hypothetical protein